MNKIEKLIAEMCPDGVERRAIYTLIDYIQPTKYIVKNPDYNINFDTPVLTAGKSFILGYTNEIDGIFIANRKNPVMIFDDFTTSMHWVDFNFKVKSSALKILIPKTLENNFRYLYYSLKVINYQKSEGTHERHWISKYSKIEIPLPPIEIQNEIVKILDNFTELEAELESELEARTKQYEFYRNKLLDFSTGQVGVPRIDQMLSERCPEGIEYVTLKKISGIQIGEFIHKNRQSIFSKYPVYNGGISETGFYDKYNRDGNQIIISARGANAGYVNKIERPFWSGNSCYTLTINENNNWYFYYYYLNAHQSLLIDSQQKGGIPAVSKKQVENFRVPLPLVEIQNEIVQILDTFSEYVTSISEGLPAEIDARRKQYEYYRNKLLTF